VSEPEIEIWRDIPGYEGCYQISNLGRVKSFVKQIGRGRCRLFKAVILKLARDKRTGYVKVNFFGERKHFRVHRIVASVFVPNDNPAQKTIVNHKNEVHWDNRASNLEWCDYVYNINYGNCPDKRRAARRKTVGKKLLCLDKETGELVKVFKTQREARAWLLGIATPKECKGRSWGISGTLRGRQLSAYGYRWKSVPLDAQIEVKV